MKYAKQLQQMLLELPSTLQDKCISYKRWKKDCKRTTLNVGDALLALQQQCRILDKAYIDAYHQSTLDRQRSACWISTYKETRPRCEDVLRFANVNAQTVYKIAKRLSKAYQSHEPLQWLVAIRARHIYAFMGGNTTTHLQLKIEKHFECPICMEDFQPNKEHKVIVFHCGHYGCLNCVLQYAGVRQMKGTWFNLLACARRRECPICRDHLAFQDSICLKD